MTRFTDIPSVLMVNTNLLGGMKIQGYEDLLDEQLKKEKSSVQSVTSSSASEHQSTCFMLWEKAIRKKAGIMWKNFVKTWMECF